MTEAVLNKPKEKVKLEFTLCHKMPERSFFYKGKQFPVCARCTGFYVSYALTLPVFTFSWWEPSFLIIGLLMIPALVDGLTQAYMNRKSNNMLRFITGVLSGTGAMALAAITGKWIGHLILLIIK
jgi:uncharacterized membrane protein